MLAIEKSVESLGDEGIAVGKADGCMLGERLGVGAGLACGETDGISSADGELVWLALP